MKTQKMHKNVKFKKEIGKNNKTFRNFPGGACDAGVPADAGYRGGGARPLDAGI